jgi:hypothetical protein
MDKSTPKPKDTWNRCDVCGKFIAIDDFDHGATRRLLTPDSDRSKEEWQTLCINHSKKNTEGDRE